MRVRHPPLPVLSPPVVQRLHVRCVDRRAAGLSAAAAFNLPSTWPAGAQSFPSRPPLPTHAPCPPFRPPQVAPRTSTTGPATSPCRTSAWAATTLRTNGLERVCSAAHLAPSTRCWCPPCSRCCPRAPASPCPVSRSFTLSRCEGGGAQAWVRPFASYLQAAVRRARHSHLPRVCASPSAADYAIVKKFEWIGKVRAQSWFGGKGLPRSRAVRTAPLSRQRLPVCSLHPSHPHLCPDQPCRHGAARSAPRGSICLWLTVRSATTSLPSRWAS